MAEPREVDDRTWMSRWLLRLCAAETPSGREDAGLEALVAMLEEIGGAVERQPVEPGRTNLLASWGPPRVLFSTHVDTVPPHLPARLDDDGITVWGRGACDAKGQIVAQLGAIRRLLEAGERRLAWLGVVGEESDSAGARAALAWCDRFKECRALINGEPTELALATGQRGLLHLRLTCYGRSAHSGSPDLGQHAAWPLLAWLEQLRGLPRPVDSDLGPEVWNLGLLRAGIAANVIPDRAVAEILARTLPESSFEVDVRDQAPPEGEVEVLLAEPPDRYPALAGFRRAAMPFGSDAPLLRDLIPDRTAVVAGPGSISVAHTPEERISVVDLDAGVDLYYRLALHFLGAFPG